MTEKEPKIICKTPIGNENEIIGYFQLVDYRTEYSIPQLEYSIDEEHREKGIISRELPIYLEWCKKNGYTKLIANVENDNEVSIYLLEKNGFIKLAEFEKINCYVNDLNLTKEQLVVGMEKLEKNGYKIKRGNK